MPTILRKLPFAVPAAAGITPIVLTSFELQALQIASLIGWWRADCGFTSTAWLDRKGDIPLVPYSVAMPTQGVHAGLDGKAVLKFATGAANGQLYDGGANLLPVNAAFSVVTVFKLASTDGANVWVNGNETTWNQFLNTGGANMRVGGSSAVASLLSGLTAGAPVLAISSWDDATNVGSLRLNRGAFVRADVAGSSQHNTNGQFHLGGVGSSTTIDGNGTDGVIAEVMIFSEALHLNATLLADVEAYLGDRYGFEAP